MRRMSSPSLPACTAFLGARRVAFGAYDEVARALAALDLSAGGLLVFDDATGALVDHPWPAGYPSTPAAAATRAAGALKTALLDPMFDGFRRARLVRFAAAVGMVEYSDALNPFLSTLFPPEVIKMGLGETISRAGLKQLRIAETEKYAHVTFFFSGGREEPFPGEERILIPSPKVATYDLQPEMSAPEVTDRIVDAIENQRYDVIVVNYANGDMVGHSGVFSAAVKAVECLDLCVGRIVDALEKVGGEALITADHGNVEQMSDESTGQAHTAHTTEPVPFIYYGKRDLKVREGGVLADVAPTMLKLLGLEQPAEMTGKSILV